MAKVMGKGDFFTTHSGKTTGPILIKLEIQNYTPEATRHANFDFGTATWVVWANSQFATVFFYFLFFGFFAKATGRTVRPIWTNEGSKRVGAVNKTLKPEREKIQIRVTKGQNWKLIRVTSSNECLKHMCVDLSDYNRYLNQIRYRTQIPHYQHAGLAKFT